MQDLIEAYMSVYSDIEEAKLPYTRRSMGLEAQFVNKTGEEKTQARIDQLRKSHNTTDNRRANTLEKKRNLVASGEAAEARANAMTTLRNRERTRFQNARDQAESFDVIDEKRLFPGAPDRSHSFPLSPEEQKLARKIGQHADAKAKKASAESPTKSGRRNPTPTPTPTNTSVSPRPTSRGITNKKGDTWTAASQHENFYDLVLDHLLDEGYCDSQESAVIMMTAMSQDWIDSITERFSMAKDTSMPQSPKPTNLPRSRDEAIGKHDDWKDKPSTEWGDRPPAGKKLKSRATAVVGTQQRQDRETGIR